MSDQMDMAVPTEWVLITGASSGIGWELAWQFAAAKSNLVLVARRREKLQQLADRLRAEHGIEVALLVEDLSAAAAATRVWQQLERDGITIDVLVNNAGCGAVGAFADLSTQRQLDMVQLNAVALTELTRRFLPGMLRRGRGGILNVASTAAFQPGPHMAVYFATKAYVLSLTEALAEEACGSGVHISCLCPGPTNTEFGIHSGIGKTWLFRLGTMDAGTVARQGYQAFRGRKAVKVTGVGNWLVSFLVRFTPRGIVRRITRLLTSTKESP